MTETFSLVYGDFGIHAIDWNWGIKNQWTRSEKDGIRWDCMGNLNHEAHQALLKRFGLENYSEEFPLETVEKMSPDELIAVRREKEKSDELKRIEVISDTVGNHIPADNFGNEELLVAA